MLCSDNMFYQSEKCHYFNTEDDCKVRFTYPQKSFNSL